jgi:endoglucanase
MVARSKAAVPRRAPARATPLLELLGDVLPIPTTSYREQGVLDYLREFARARGLDHRQDPFGNAYVTYRRGRARRPMVLQAHTDHPGFVVTSVRGPVLQLEFRGGLAAEYGRGEYVRVYGEALPERGVQARITSVQVSKPAARGAPRRLAGARARLEAKPLRGAEIREGDLALWDVTPFRVRDELVQARQCDDLAGCVTVLATLDRVAAAGEPGHLVGLFTRAEEVGLEGAAAAAVAGELPADALVVALETSSSAGGRAKQGDGPIVRVGDRSHIFSPAMTMWMTSLAQQLASEVPGFTYQRKLMDAGGTEATAFDLLGYETGAACLALGNWHNAGPRGRVRAETVHLRDLEGLIRLCERMVADAPSFPRAIEAARTRWRSIGVEAGERLQAQP